MNYNINNVIRIPTSLESETNNIFKYWFIFLKPFHKLANREIDVIACFLKHRYILSKAVKDNALLDTITMSESTKRKVREECNVTLPHFQVIMGKLRKNGVIIDGKINPRYVPNIKEESGSLQLLLLFDFSNVSENNK